MEVSACTLSRHFLEIGIQLVRIVILRHTVCVQLLICVCLHPSAIPPISCAQLF